MPGTGTGLATKQNWLDKLFMRLFHESSLSSNIRALKRDTPEFVMHVPFSATLVTAEETDEVKARIRERYELANDEFIVAVGLLGDDPRDMTMVLTIRRKPPEPEKSG